MPAAASGDFECSIKGHTYFFENYVSNNTRAIKPGSLYSTDECSVAILDIDNDRVERIRVEEE